MRLNLKIENHSSLPDGGPLSITVNGERGIDIGRDQYLDWTLPDVTRYISGKHCEVRYREDAYWLTDVSTNGTFLNGADHRMQSPYRLRTGDRLLIGEYIIAVTVEGAEGCEGKSAVTSTPAPAQDLWRADFEAAPPIDPKHLRSPHRERPVAGDFLEHAMDDPPPRLPRATNPFGTSETPPAPSPQHPRAGELRAGELAAADPDGDWAPLVPNPPPVKAVPQPPAPRNIASSEPGVWSDADRAATVPAAERSSPEREFLRRFAVRAGLPESVFNNADAGEKAEELADILRTTIAELMQLLKARSEAKRFTRSAHQTMVQATDNNPLKFSPTPEEALRLLFGTPSHSYLSGPRALQQSFADLKSHQLNSYSAMQAAVRMLADDLDPEKIEQSIDADGGLSAVLASRRARLWDAYVARWRTKTKRHDDGLVDVFMLYFAECYDRISNGKA
jgi:type VI secretion system protein ImpI